MKKTGIFIKNLRGRGTGHDQSLQIMPKDYGNFWNEDNLHVFVPNKGTN